MNSFNTFQQFALTQQQQTNITGGNNRVPQTEAATLQVIPQIIPQLTSSVNTWSNEATFITGNTTTRGRG
ncbi:hypothetical protein C7N43_20215 [Sphingobacteriales bacterium UPWRP_1]|nr:hypothetical protein B6N25_01880 [Sphingobacteriales bacterium TSM_CSS]PSJ75200.1 hypothetical protein C7N43_20215 [Sphingobacteriales bacterium UPWRP_1]